MKKTAQKKRLFKIVLFAIALLPLLAAAKIAFAVYVRPNIDSIEKGFPKETAMMRHNGDAGKVKLSPVPLSSISPKLIRAVLLSEDISFFYHNGIDWAEFRLSMEYNWKRKEIRRGGSTITMQLARNLFLSPARNPFRKIEEMLLAKRIERRLSKRRILELYLNIAEMGPHIYGIEPAARHHFGVSPWQLSVEQSCAIASILPSPKKWDPANPSKGVQKRIDSLIKRYQTSPLRLPEDLS